MPPADKIDHLPDAPRKPQDGRWAPLGVFRPGLLAKPACGPPGRDADAVRAL